MLQSGRTDFDKLLRLTGDQLRLKITKALAHPKSRLVVSYGGALHNDLHPDGKSAPYSFAPAVSAQVGGALVELDLYVPEYIGKGCVVRAGCEEEGADTGRAQPRFVCFAVPAKEVTAWNLFSHRTSFSMRPKTASIVPRGTWTLIWQCGRSSTSSLSGLGWPRRRRRELWRRMR